MDGSEVEAKSRKSPGGMARGRDGGAYPHPCAKDHRSISAVSPREKLGQKCVRRPCAGERASRGRRKDPAGASNKERTTSELREIAHPNPRGTREKTRAERRGNGEGGHFRTLPGSRFNCRGTVENRPPASAPEALPFADSAEIITPRMTTHITRNHATHLPAVIRFCILLELFYTLRYFT